MIFLITGANGFLGKIISQYIHDRGNKVITLGRTGNDINVDLARNQNSFHLPYSDVIVHAAGKAHFYPKTRADRKEFFDVNVNGTETLLNSINTTLKPRKFIFMSSVAVYGLDQGHGITEDYPLKANDSYGLSKISAEKLVEKWCKNNGIEFLILRLPLIAGPNAPGNLGKMINALKKRYYFNIDGGKAKKSVVLASDIANLIMNLPDNFESGIYNLTDGYHPSFLELSNHISSELGLKKPLNLPLWFIKPVSLFGDIFGHNFPLNSIALKKISFDLTFNDDKARNKLGWISNFALNSFKPI
jgi:nucleoside-diphosphate-sugar epimerase